jgi:hypothetical protein
MRKQNYLNNKDMLKEIHKSKLTYCHLIDDEYGRFDIIVEEYDDIFKPEVIQQARENRASQLSSQGYEDSYDKWQASGKRVKDKPKQAETRVNPDDINPDDIIFRLMTFDHVPEDGKRKTNPKIEADHYTKVNFPPFKHYAKHDGEMCEVVRSHWEGGIDNGKFSTTHGHTNNELAKMYIKLCERYSMRSNWRGYTYVDEMRSHALMQLSQIGLKFNEAKSQNPFAYYTAVVTNSFTRVLNLEKRNQNIRDDLLQEHGFNPSFSRQLDHEASEKAKYDEQIEKERKEATGANF